MYGVMFGRPDIVHCHDWQAAPVAFANIAPAKPVFTIHNLNYGADLIGRAMAAAAAATTVSPTYAVEVQHLHGLCFKLLDATFSSYTVCLKNI